MFSFQKTSYGFKLTFGGKMPAEELERWVATANQMLSDQKPSFKVLVDMRTLETLDAEAQELMIRGQMLFRQTGMIRSVVILNNPDTTRQFRNLAKMSGIFHWERYIDASSTPEWEEIAISWLIEGVEVNPTFSPLKKAS